MKKLLGPILVTALLLIFVWVIGGRVVAMLRTGEPLLIAIALAVALVTLVGVAVLVKEWQLGVTVQKMANTLAARGELIADDLPRSPGGRIDRAAADARFVQLRAQAQANPTSWAAWFQLGFGYDAAGDRKRARGALRQAAKLFRGVQAR